MRSSVGVEWLNAQNAKEKLINRIIPPHSCAMNGEQLICAFVPNSLAKQHKQEEVTSTLMLLLVAVVTEMNWRVAHNPRIYQAQFLPKFVVNSY